MLGILFVTRFIPTIASWSGNYRSMKAWVPKHQSMQLKNTTQVCSKEHIDFNFNWIKVFLFEYLGSISIFISLYIV